MIAAVQPIQRSAQAKLVIVDAYGHVSHAPRHLIDVLRPGDLVAANDAATLPASLHGEHLPSGRVIEVRLAGRRSLERDDVREFAAIVFGEGDFHSRTEDRPAPPLLETGDRLRLGPLLASVLKTLGHPRLVWLGFDGTPDAIWAGLARHGRPIQYAHIPEPLALWDVWTVIAGPPVAFRRPATRRSMPACRSTSRTPFPEQRLSRSVARGGKAVASWRSARRSFARSSTPLSAMAMCTRARGWRINGSGRQRGCESSTRSSRAFTNRERVIINC
jgi:hypothetical protein